MRVRGLTLWQPWDQAVLLGTKAVENRPRRWALEGVLLAVHAGQRWDRDGAAAIQRLWPDAPAPWGAGIRTRARGGAPDRTGHVVGAALVREVRHVDEIGPADGKLVHPWASGPWCYLLEDRVAFDSADWIRATGRQGLFRLPGWDERRVVELWEAGRAR